MKSGSSRSNSFESDSDHSSSSGEPQPKLPALKKAVGSTDKTKVLVTGGNGYLGSHIVKELLDCGVSVKVSVHDLGDEKRYHHLKMLKGQERLEIVEGKLTQRGCWRDILEGCEAVIHTASPTPFKAPKQELDVIYPAVEGTLAILMAAVELGISRVVMTSCYTAVRGSKWSLYYNEESWGEPENVTSIDKSKLFAERAAWFFAGEHLDRLDLTVFCPGFLLGPCLQRHFDFASAIFFKRFLDGRVSSLLDMYMPFVDVRDAALVHVQALWNDAAKNQRYLCVQDSQQFADLSKVLSREFQAVNDEFKFPQNTIPALSLKLIALFDSRVRTLLPFYGKGKEVSFNKEKLKQDFHFNFRSFEETVRDMGKDFIDKKFVERVKPKALQEEEVDTTADFQLPDLVDHK